MKKYIKFQDWTDSVALFEAFLKRILFLEISCRERVNASVTRGGSVRIGGGVRATQAHIGRTGALVVCFFVATF